jgi:hypothetical protein
MPQTTLTPRLAPVPVLVWGDAEADLDSDGSISLGSCSQLRCPSEVEAGLERGEAEVGTGLKRVHAALNRADFLHCSLIEDYALTLKPSGGENRGEEARHEACTTAERIGSNAFFFLGRLYIKPPLQMSSKSAAPINSFVGVAGVISHPLQMTRFIGAVQSSRPCKSDL